MILSEISDLYRRIATVTTRYAFTRPVELPDLDAMRGLLETAVPELEWSFWRTDRGVRVTGRDEQDRVVYEREMLCERSERVAGDTPPA